MFSQPFQQTPDSSVHNNTDPSLGDPTTTDNIVEITPTLVKFGPPGGDVVDYSDMNQVYNIFQVPMDMFDDKETRVYLSWRIIVPLILNALFVVLVVMTLLDKNIFRKTKVTRIIVLLITFGFVVFAVISL